jgi:poly(A) polymerase
VAERARLAIQAQRTMREPPRRRRRRGRGPGAQTFFADAMQLMQISVEATGQGREVLERWSAAPQEEPPPAPERVERVERGVAVRAAGEPRAAGKPRPAGKPRELVVDGSARAVEAGERTADEGDGQPGGRRRRRRRGGRRRRRRGAGEAAPAGGSAPGGA